MEQRRQTDARIHQVGLTPATALRLVRDSRWLREREKAREAYLMEVLRKKRREEKQS
jgi:hypothetical protein